MTIMTLMAIADTLTELTRIAQLVSHDGPLETLATRADEAFVIVRGAKPLRCGRAVYFRRPEWAGLVGQNRFYQDAAD